MSRSHTTTSTANVALDQLNFANRGLGGDPSISAARPVLRRAHHEQLAKEESLQHQMSRLSKDERAAVEKAAQRAEIRRAKARERMAIRRAKIKSLPHDEQLEYHDKARQARAKWREGNRHYLAIASWGYRHRKYVEMVETCAERTLYDEYLTKTSIRRSKRERAQLRQEAKAAEAARELSDLPDSSEIATSDSE